MADVIDKDLRLIAENLGVFIGEDKDTKQVLKLMGLTFEDISKELREETVKIMETLKNDEIDHVKRIDSVWDTIEGLSNDINVPSNIRKMIFSTALKRLEDARSNAMWAKGEREAVKEIGKITYSLDLFLNDDKKTQMVLKRMGITEVPEIVKNAAKETKEIMNDKKLDRKERALRAAEILTGPMTPGRTGKRLGDIRDVQKAQLQQEIKSVLWEIANDFTYQAAKS